ncbi:hypothetical protein ABZ918_10715 [Streptomyces viridosporus]|uniref:hypothetical protein n=1 Tax=Streptomyces viridosporus TaxID=67581 RepID=UPI00342B0423
MNDEDELDEGSENDEHERRPEPFRSPAWDHFFQFQRDWAKSWVNPINRIIADSAVFKFNLPRTYLTRPIVPPAVIQATRLQAQLREFNSFNSSMRTLVATVSRSYAPQWQSIFENIRRFSASIFPENWEGVDRPSIDEFETLLIDEGIALMWVPGPKVIQALLNADTAAERRRIIGRRWKRIAADCEAALTDVTHPALQDAKRFGLDCVSAIQDGHTSAAQALAGNLLDSVLRKNFDNAARLEVTRNNFKKNGVRFNLDDYKIRAAFTFAPVWCAHAKYRTEDGDPIPRTFGRHPTTHAVSRAQYSRINAVMGLMLVTSVIKFFDTELTRRSKREKR